MYSIKRASLMLLLLMTAGMVYACDVCSLMYGVTPLDRLNQLSFGYRFRQYTGTMSSMGIAGQAGSGKVMHADHADHNAAVMENMTEQYHTMTASFRFFTGNRLQWMLMAPFKVVSMSGEGGYNRAGLGDLTLSGRYMVLSKEDTTFSYRVWAGGGIVLPTGLSRISSASTDYNHFPGSGSVNYITNASAQIRYKSFGLMNELTWQINSENTYGFRNGNFLMDQLMLFYIHNFAGGKVRLMPQAGAFLDHHSGEYLNGSYLENTGGTSIYASTGLNVYLGNSGLRLKADWPLSLNYKGEQMETGPVLNTELFYTF